MNQPAAKEPTMDEILSSIRQIIADDDESAAQKVPAAAASGGHDQSHGFTTPCAGLNIDAIPLFSSGVKKLIR